MLVRSGGAEGATENPAWVTERTPPPRPPYCLRVLWSERVQLQASTSFCCLFPVQGPPWWCAGLLPALISGVSHGSVQGSMWYWEGIPGPPGLRGMHSVSCTSLQPWKLPTTNLPSHLLFTDITDLQGPEMLLQLSLPNELKPLPRQA